MPPMKAQRHPRPIKESTFLDDPSLYPEYAALTTNLPALHAFRTGLHVHRTAVLLLLVAVCMAVSGVPMPPVDGEAWVKEWRAFAFHAMGIDRLVGHFEGFSSGLAAMGVVASIALLVYPLHSLAAWPSRLPTTMAAREPHSGAGYSVGTFIVVAGLPSTVLWVFALWVQSRCEWALGPGLWFGLFCACVTLKITSFVASASASAAAAALAREKISAPGEISAANAVAAAEGVPLSLTFREYLFFQFLSPSLVCEMHLLRVSARRKSRPLRAASEFFHAGLTFLCAHCVVGSLLAPAMRLFISGLRPGWVGGAGASWTELEAAGGAGWPSWTAGSAFLAGGADEAKGLGPVVTLACFLWMVLVVCTIVHFLVFYAFWHCVCLGMAELFGFPDRNLYGCWWLLFDEPRDFLRLWSVPVHRWLLACVHWPMLELTGGSDSSCGIGGGGGGGSVGTRSSGPPSLSVASPPTTAPTSAPVTSKMRAWLPAVVATFFVSIVFHELVVMVAMRGSCWPFNTFLLIVASLLIITWDAAFPLRQIGPAEGVNPSSSSHDSSVSNQEKAGSSIGGVGSSAGGKVVRVYGHRGLVSTVVFSILVQLSAFIADCAAWLWWRQIHMKTPTG